MASPVTPDQTGARPVKDALGAGCLALAFAAEAWDGFTAFVERGTGGREFTASPEGLGLAIKILDGMHDEAAKAAGDG